MNYSLFHFISYFIMFILFVLVLKSYEPVSLEMEILSLGDLSLVVSLIISFNNLVFIFTVYSIFTSVFHYSMSYMSSDPGVKRFLMILSSFVVSMIILICSGNFFTALLGWDGLGVSSLLLIMHYCSKSSLKASMYTFLMNRLGDCFFLYVIFNLFCKYPSLNILLQNVKEQNNSVSMVMVFMILLSITKSAQIPFSSWLTKAMEAPTPVSSLVHSSTLVTAGIFMLYNYQDLWKSSELMSTLLMILAVSTLLMASICGLVEMDLKKIVAYSTLSQLGFIFFLFSIDVFEAGFFYLIMHAFFKALMFMSSGYIIHNSHGWQDIRKMSINQVCSPTMVKIFYVSSMSLCGMPFLAGFYSKDIVFDKVISTEYPFSIFFLMIVAFTSTLFYTLRVCWYLSCGVSSYTSMCDQDKIMIKSSLTLYVMSCFMGSLMMWIYLPSTIPVDSPKIGLTTYLLGMGMLFWIWPMKKTSFFLKTMFYLYIVHSIIVKWYTKVSQEMMWYFDLLGLMGKFLKTPPKTSLSEKYTKWLKNSSWSLSDFLIISFLIMFLSFFLN